MNRDDAKILLPVIQAFAEGKPIEFFSRVMGGWKTVEIATFDAGADKYRIKPREPRIVWAVSRVSEAGMRLCEDEAEALNLCAAWNANGARYRIIRFIEEVVE